MAEVRKPEYIEREAVLKKMQNWNTKGRLIDCVENAPAADVIEASELHEFFAEFIKKQNQCIDILEKMVVADLVEVVRCKDCKYFRYNERYKYSVCRHKNGLIGKVAEDYYCSYGERKK
jgi:hypothetical protein